MSPRDIVILGAARTPIGRYGGTFRNVHPAELGGTAVRAALERSGLAPEGVDELQFGHGRQAGSGPNPARQVVRRAGLPDAVPAATINKACASGMQAVVNVAQTLLLGESRTGVAGGMESMSRMPYMVESEDARWGRKMGHMRLVDAMYQDGFQCPLSGLIMGETADILGKQYDITREQSDRFALGSQQKAEAAIGAGRFTEEIAPVTLEARGKATVASADEHPRATTMESLGKLPPVFGKDGIVTAGSSSGITDGAAALVLATAEHAKAHGLTPLARLVGWASAGVDPRIMGIGPVPAVKKLLGRTGLTLGDFDLVEINEAFAAQVLAVLRDLPIDEARLNVNGGSIALGHPIGCTGARILVTLLYEMRRRGNELGLATLCVSGGMGMAVAVEAL